MKIVVGLGNPGEEYENTRHNVGFSILDKLKTEIFKSQFSNTKQVSSSKFQFSKRFGAEVLDAGEIKLVKPQRFMNRSGEVVAKIVAFYKVGYGDLCVVHDDLDIRLGEYKVVWAKGPKVHNGVNSVVEKLGSDQFWRVRVGIEARENDEEKMIPGEKYVLGKFDEKERLVLNKVKADIIEELAGKL